MQTIGGGGKGGANAFMIMNYDVLSFSTEFEIYFFFLEHQPKRLLKRLARHGTGTWTAQSSNILVNGIALIKVQLIQFTLEQG